MISGSGRPKTGERGVAIVTGASSGIGAALARVLAEDGFAVGLTARREAELNALADAIRADGGRAAVAPADAADRQGVIDAMARLEAELGPADWLIANAGVGLETGARGFSAEAFHRMIRVNLIGPAAAIEAVLPGMLMRGRGRIAAVSSLAAYRGIPGSAGYSASKAALSTLMEGLRAELRRTGVSFTTVHPGIVRTPMTSWAPADMPFTLTADEAARIIRRGIAAGRSEVNFPTPVALLFQLIRVLPNALYDPLADRYLRLSSRSRRGP